MKAILITIGLLVSMAASAAQFVLLDIPLSTSKIAQVVFSDKTLVTTNATAQLAEMNMAGMLQTELNRKIAALTKATCDLSNLNADKRPVATNKNVVAIVSALSGGAVTFPAPRATREYFSSLAELRVSPSGDPEADINSYIRNIDLVNSAIIAAKK